MLSYFKKSSVVSKNLKLSEISGMIQPKADVVSGESKPSINHVFCIDVSGSMGRDLPKMRIQLKSRLVEIVHENDTITLIWFDHNCGIISELAHMTSVNDVRDMNKKIDEFLKPGGCTNFLDPVKLTNELINRMNSTEGLWNFIFLSDGGHNTGGTWSEVIGELSTLQSKISSATIVEYGYYADSNRLTEMAETLGGNKIFDEDFQSYEVDFENVMKTSTSTVPRVEFDITDFKPLMKLQVMFTVDPVNKSINVYSTERLTTILIPETTEKIYFLEKRNKSTEESSENACKDNYSNYQPIYAAIYILAERMKYNLAEELLYSTKDKEMIDLYCNAFGKQKLENFKAKILDRCYGDTKATEFINSTYKSNPKKYCVLDLVDDLTSSDDNKIYVFHPDFNYTRTGAKSVTKIELTEDERKRLSEASTKLKADKVLEEVSENQVKMVVLGNSTSGYSVNSIVWNNERANLSFQIEIPVELTVPNMDKSKDPYKVSSFITRNYTLIKDGILNVTSLPISVNSTLKGKFKRMGLVVKEEENGIMVIDFSSMPIINRKRTETVFSYNLGKLEVDLLENRCYNKYLSYLKPASISSSKTYTEEEKYHQSLGITSRGYSPKTELDKSGDFYMATSLVTKIEKFSSIPKIEDVLKKRESGKPFTVSEKYLDSCMSKIDAVLDSAQDRNEAFEDLLFLHKKESKRLISEISKIKFAMIVSRKWFADKTDYNDNSISVNIDGSDLKIFFEFVDKKVNL